MQKKGGWSREEVISGMDFFRKIPADLMTEANTEGGCLSLLTILAIVVLVFSETVALCKRNIVTSVEMDRSGFGRTEKIQLNLNITMMDMQCDYVSLDVSDSLGTNSIDVMTNIEKWSLDAEGVKTVYKGRNRRQVDLLHDSDSEGNNKHGTLEELHEDGVHATALDAASFKKMQDEYDFLFVDFFAPWCIWCQRLAPTWEKFAEEIGGLQNPPTPDVKPSFQDVLVASVDCVEHTDFCGEQSIMAFPTLRIFFKGEKFGGDFKGDRTLEGLRHFLFTAFEANGYETDHPAKVAHFKAMKKVLEDENANPNVPKPSSWNAVDHPGCMVSGQIWVNRVPGNIHIEAKSSYQNINAKMTNVSHIVNHFSFGDAHTKRFKERMTRVPEGFSQVAALDGNVYVNSQQHAAYHHFIKVVPTYHYDRSTSLISFTLDLASTVARMFSFFKNSQTKNTYNQFLAQSQIMYYDAEAVPEAKFTFDISPMIVTVKYEVMPFYDYIVKLLGLMGATYTFFQLLDRGVSTIKKKVK